MVIEQKAFSILYLGGREGWENWIRSQIYPSSYQIKNIKCVETMEEWEKEQETNLWDFCIIDYAFLRDQSAFSTLNIGDNLQKKEKMVVLLDQIEDKDSFLLLLMGGYYVHVMLKSLVSGFWFLCLLGNVEETEKERYYCVGGMLSEILRESPMGIMITNELGKILFCNLFILRLLTPSIPSSSIDLFSIMGEDDRKTLQEGYKQVQQDRRWKGQVTLKLPSSKVLLSFDVILILDPYTQSLSRNIVILLFPASIHTLCHCLYTSVQKFAHLKMTIQGYLHDLNNVFSPVLMGMFLLRSSSSHASSGATIRWIEESVEKGTIIIRQVQELLETMDFRSLTLNPRYELRYLIQTIQGLLSSSLPIQWEIARYLPLIDMKIEDFEEVFLSTFFMVWLLVRRLPNEFKVVATPWVNQDQKGLRIKISCDQRVYFPMWNQGGISHKEEDTLEPIFEDSLASPSRVLFGWEQYHRLYQLMKKYAIRMSVDYPQENLTEVSLLIPEKKQVKTSNMPVVHDVSSLLSTTGRSLILLQDESLHPILKNVFVNQNGNCSVYSQAVDLLQSFLKDPESVYSVVLLNEPLPWEKRHYLEVMYALCSECHFFYLTRDHHQEDPSVPFAVPISSTIFPPPLSSILG